MPVILGTGDADSLSGGADGDVILGYAADVTPPQEWLFA